MKRIDWGLVNYPTALEGQLDLVSQVAAGSIDDQLVFCSHPPIVTLGRSSSSRKDLDGWRGETIDVSRGGRATYHGPSQQLVYPILNLAKPNRPQLQEKDIHAYLRCMEQILVKSFDFFGLKSEARTVSVEQAGEKPLSLTGVWIKDKKVASIGVAVKQWVTYHGAAINVDNDPLAFTGIRPCGFQKEIMTSLEVELGNSVSREELQSQIETWSRHYWG